MSARGARIVPDPACDRHGQHRPYRLTCDAFRTLLEQAKGMCQICRTAPATVIDHDHELTIAHVRGVLCTPCNLALGRVDRGARFPTSAELAYLTSAWHLTSPPSPPPTVREGKVLKACRVRPKLLDEVTAACEERGLTFTAAVERALEAWVKS